MKKKKNDLPENVLEPFKKIFKHFASQPEYYALKEIMKEMPLVENTDTGESFDMDQLWDAVFNNDKDQVLERLDYLYNRAEESEGTEWELEFIQRVRSEYLKAGKVHDEDKQALNRIHKKYRIT